MPEALVTSRLIRREVSRVRGRLLAMLRGDWIRLTESKFEGGLAEIVISLSDSSPSATIVRSGLTTLPAGDLVGDFPLAPPLVVIPVVGLVVVVVVVIVVVSGGCIAMSRGSGDGGGGAGDSSWPSCCRSRLAIDDSRLPELAADRVG